MSENKNLSGKLVHIAGAQLNLSVEGHGVVGVPLQRNQLLVIMSALGLDFNDDFTRVNAYSEDVLEMMLHTGNFRPMDDKGPLGKEG